MLWKKLDDLYNKQKFHESLLWCQLALHNMFRNAGDSNTGKVKRYMPLQWHVNKRLTIHRKMVLCHLGLSKPIEARSELDQMSEAQRSSPFTEFLAFQVAMKSHDEQLGRLYVD